jgi:hypothetical protein
VSGGGRGRGESADGPAAAPILQTGAILTFYGLGLGLVEYQLKNVALVMLLSGGTFLFVATAHILPEILHSGELTWRQVCPLLSLKKNTLLIIIYVLINPGNGRPPPLTLVAHPYRLGC